MAGHAASRPTVKVFWTDPRAPGLALAMRRLSIITCPAVSNHLE
jgi:hypothetical protein